MLRIILILILSPIIILAATMAVCAIIAAGFDIIIKLAIVAAIVCGVRYVFSITRGKVH